ncbi:wolframin-like isoform X1 [Stylophora pistillata]|uniref:Wolframin n=2 Tax=Stylophora pistillata TaxID=50429 RepID=A0A2B4SIW3_STYPI|nr:wolframin-like isoform X1 [Stylophora pistillata]XP_022785975.1 wolframin-like isoform X1 [Stylophora pistillata]XP_022785976.1 wolframin-like isoform X1 [Stylophora pistillata]XP_022785977.1 wolframin-like isoform X1 [Stylophora pistillata]PFX28412.1 Wolframin [Stylophora pistillata]
MEGKISHAEELLKSSTLDKKEEAVNILIGISKQGNEEATATLAKCLKDREGINAENEHEVMWCVNTKEEDKRLQHAVEVLYNSMKKNDEDKLALQDIDEALKKPEAKLKEKETASQDTSSIEDLEKDQEKIEQDLGLMSLLMNALTVGGQNEFTLSELKDTALAYARGEVPEVVILLSKEDMEKFQKASVLEKIVQFPQQSLESAKHFLLVKISKEGSSFLKSLIPTSQIYMLFLLYIYSNLTGDFLWFLVPLVVFYISFISMVVFSLQMFYGREALRKLQSVSELMKKFDPRLDAQETERTFMWKSSAPYVYFFIVLLIAVAVLPLCDKQWIPCSEMALVALFFTVSSFRGLPDKYADYALYTILLKLLTTGLRSLENVRVLGVLCYPIFSVPLPSGLELEISLPSLLHVVILVLLIIMAGRHSWRGIYKVLVPHVVCLLWCQLFTELFHFTSWASLLRATVGWVIFVTMLPLLFLFTIGLTIAYFVKWFMALDIALKLAVTAIILAVTSAFFYYSKLETPYLDKLRRKKKLLMVVAGLAVLCLLVPIVFVNFVPSLYDTHKSLTWAEYSKTCGLEARESENVNLASVQIQCSELQGQSVNWTGTVAYVKVTSLENRFRNLLAILPVFLRPTFKCLLGGGEADNVSSPPQKSSWLPRARGPCHLRTFDRYTFSVGVNMTDSKSYSSEVIQVTVKHRFYHTMVTLQKYTQITFEGRLQNGPPYVTVSAKRLYIDGAKVKPRIGLGRDDIYEGLRDSGRFVAQFFMTPLVIERDEDDDD